MRTFRVDGNNDLAISGRGLSMAIDREAVMQTCQQAARAILGEMVFSANTGMPFFETVWVGQPDSAPFESAFRERIPQVEGVTGIEQLDVARDGDVMKYTARIATVYGTGEVNGSV